jgi:lipopolysaccharide export system protein LptA
MRFFKFLILTLLLIPFFAVIAVIQPPILIGPEDIFLKPNTIFFPDESKKKSPIPTRWGGNSLTQMEKTFEGFPMTVFVLGGGAWIYHNKVRLSSSEIEIIGEDAIRADLKGRVQVEDQENGSSLSASKGYYDKLSSKITLEGRPRLVYTSTDRKKTYISAEKIVRYIDEGRTVLEGKVYVISEEYSVIGEDAVYSDSDKTLILAGRPFLFGENRFLTGESLSYNTESGEVALDGKAIFLQTSFEEEKDSEESSGGLKFGKSKKKETESTPKEKKEAIKTTYSFADKMLRSSKGSEPYTGLVGNASIIREDIEFYAEEIKSYGSDGEKLVAKTNVKIWDVENHTSMTGDLLEYFKERKYSHITGKPKIEVWDKEDTKVSTTITAVEIERFEEKKEMVTRGNVVIESETSIAKGEYATYYEVEEKIVLEGDPTLERDGKILNSGKIIIYPQEDRVILSEGLNFKGTE